MNANLVKKRITDKNGKPTFVWVNSNGKPVSQGRDKKVQPPTNQRQKQQEQPKQEKQAKGDNKKMGKTETKVRLTLAGVADAMEDKINETSNKVKDWKSKQEAFYSGDHGKSDEIDEEMKAHLNGEFEKLSLTQKAGDLLKKKAKGIVSGLKREVEGWKEAGTGLANFAKGKEVTPEQKRALVAVAKHTLIVVASTAVTGGLAGGAAAIAKGLGMHFVEHSLFVRGAHALAFAKAKEDADKTGEDSGDDDAEATKALEDMVMKLGDFISEHGAK